MPLTYAFRLAPGAQALDQAILAEKLGYERVWSPEIPAFGHDIWVHLARLAERTQRIGIGPAVLNPSYGQGDGLITSSEVFRIEVDGKLQITRMEYRHFNDDPIRHRQSRGQPGEYHCVDEFELRSVMRAAIGESD